MSPFSLANNCIILGLLISSLGALGGAAEKGNKWCETLKAVRDRPYQHQTALWNALVAITTFFLTVAAFLQRNEVGTLTDLCTFPTTTPSSAPLTDRIRFFELSLLWPFPLHETPTIVQVSLISFLGLLIARLELRIDIAAHYGEDTIRG